MTCRQVHLPTIRKFAARRNTEQSMKTVTNVPGPKCYQRARLQKPKPPKILLATNFPVFDGWRDCKIGLEGASSLGWVSPTFRILTQIRKLQSTAARFL